ncbi:hypothetical protein MF672_033460 [Actinomadura sp. ATCC 31491]|uniref:Uncharacterized protein n=1 Tax=Actinomadura luzonensis TaxID=2805427 RepID=A0ABT0G3G0_9ACTN|nr:hypothetical protein [Actinomadura luzonensis]MCK2218668.1 hypothetical protein [Actinomadura luzonensis]
MTSDRRVHYSSRQEEAQALWMEIGDRVRAAAGPGWSRLGMRHDQVGAHGRTAITRDGRELPAAGLGLDGPFRRLRELSYLAGAGTWCTCELEFAPGSRGYRGRVSHAEQPFEEVPPAAALAELTAFARLEPPAWLLSALPTAVPIGLADDYAARYGFWRDTPEEPLPIDGELSYAPAAGMTARLFDHQQEHGHRMLFLAERAGDQEGAQFCLSTLEDRYWIARQDGRGTGEGLRALTLDGDRLLLELTPEAADALAAETVFTVRLDLPPGRDAALRAVLPGMLRPVGQAPVLTGF